jgi:RNA polymerase sigma-70 factor (ECF subfamily)
MPDFVSSLTLPLAKTRVVETNIAPAKEQEGITSLTRRLEAGDENAFREFHKVYAARLYQFLLVVERGNEDEAKEALQLSMLRVVRYARPFESEEVFWDWLKMAARSAARDAGRKTQRYTAMLRLFSREIPAGEPSRLTPTNEHLGDLLEESLEELVASDRELVEGKYVEGLSVHALAQRSGQSLKATESRLLRVRKKLRESILGKLRQEEL